MNTPALVCIRLAPPLARRLVRFADGRPLGAVARVLILEGLDRAERDTARTRCALGALDAMTRAEARVYDAAVRAGQRAFYVDEALASKRGRS